MDEGLPAIAVSDADVVSLARKLTDFDRQLTPAERVLFWGPSKLHGGRDAPLTAEGDPIGGYRVVPLPFLDERQYYQWPKTDSSTSRRAT